MFLQRFGIHFPLRFLLLNSHRLFSEVPRDFSPSQVTSGICAVVISMQLRYNLGLYRLGHGELNIDGHCNRICQCGAVKTEHHMFQIQTHPLTAAPTVKDAKDSCSWWRWLLVLSTKSLGFPNFTVWTFKFTQGTMPRAPKSPNNVASTFCSAIRLLTKDLRLEHRGAKLVSCPVHHLTSVRPWSRLLFQTCLLLPKQPRFWFWLVLRVYVVINRQFVVLHVDCHCT